MTEPTADRAAEPTAPEPADAPAEPTARTAEAPTPAAPAAEAAEPAAPGPEAAEPAAPAPEAAEPAAPAAEPAAPQAEVAPEVPEAEAEVSAAADVTATGAVGPGGMPAVDPQLLFGSLNLAAIEADIEAMMSDKMSELDGMLAGLEELVGRLESEITSLETPPPDDTTTP
ncbi:hypothetical protein [Saccharothrix variisporea]|uniref:Uncharacterized protein n=1 Tax=Saccharothrix variisporea TaxID=543527 RepID=A0A495XFI5_9PSEU|nr:hypothetical protein [Saccharothrix variisporea]RKT71895.1 hypothetical protein DFJ66_5194 [Saccharothrix variisporea]